ncbi:hypothetical protein [Mycolicibacterium llatzerense]|uniref:hypothetical protein n=1 Tax=Mycolicibacterium llatzerense TaxID=280871 RepID=UPI0021B6B0C5|nr:hypothetical protein [Mycolicibacterium llatzerense]MCT7372714.1 hypothetical protein [Mycolicibacterium llatzerense]
MSGYDIPVPNLDGSRVACDIKTTATAEAVGNDSVRVVLSMMAEFSPIGLTNDPRLVDGRILVAPSVWERLKAQAGADISRYSRGPIVGIPVEVIPDDGQPHAIGGGKVAVVSQLDHTTVVVMPEDVVGKFEGLAR